ncbi:MAG: cell division protein SepF [Solirubrobacteraceae bacterium]
MALRDSWRRALVVSGLVDDRPSTNPDFLALERPPTPGETAPAEVAAHWQPPEPEMEPEPTADPTGRYRDHDAAQIVVRRMAAADPRAYRQEPEARPELANSAPLAAAPPPTPAAGTPPPPPRPAAALPPAPPPPVPPREVSVHRVRPQSFNDAQQLADRFKAATPVILDLQGVETDLAKRLMGFASGLTYGLDGGMERLDDRVFLLVPAGVEISAGQRARLAAQGSLNRV